jgi:hypothetical protein
MKINYSKSFIVLFTVSSLFIMSLDTETGFSKSFFQSNKRPATLQYRVFTVSRETAPLVCRLLQKLPR